MNPQDKDPQRIKKSDKEYINKLDYSGIEFLVTTKQYNEIEKQNEINIKLTYLDMKTNNHIPSLCQKKNMTDR